VNELLKIKKNISIVISIFNLFVLIIFLVSSTNISVSGQSSLSDSEIENAIANSDIIAFYDQNSLVDLDGELSLNEYSYIFNDSDSEIDFFIEHNQSHLFIGLIAPTQGWIGVGFNDLGLGMENSDIKLGAIINDIPYMEDTYATGYSVPINDTNNSGTNDISAFIGVEDSFRGNTFEFIIPFNSLDVNDYNLEINTTLTLFLAHGPVDDYSTIHTAHSKVLKLFIAPEFIKPPKKTDLILSIAPDTIIDGEEKFELLAILTNQSNGIPLVGYNVSFYVKTDFGELKLGENITDQNGVAKIVTSIQSELSEGKTLIARFSTIESYFQSSDNLNIDYTGNIIEHGEGSEYGIVVPALTVIGSIVTLIIIWTTFLYVLSLLYSNFRNSGNEEMG
jgi:hypothetical protein